MERKTSKALLRARTASLENILFNVEQVELTPNREQFTEYDFGGQYASIIYCPSMNKVLHLSGRNYQLITNEQLIMPIYDKLQSMFGESGFDVSCMSEDDRRFSARFVLKDKVIEVAQKDYVNLMIEVQNSYDGSLRHSLGLSYFRQVCTNGLMAWRKETALDNKHVSDYVPNLEIIIKRLDELDNSLQQFRKLTERRVSSKEIDGIMEKLREFKHNDSFPKKLLSEVSMKVHQEVEQLNSEPNAWILYNGFNNILNHHPSVGLAMDIKERVDRNVLRLIRQELSLN